MTARNHNIHMMNRMPMGVIVTDVNGNIQSINSYAKRIMNTLTNATRHQHIDMLFGDENLCFFKRMDRTPLPDNAYSYKITKGNKTLEVGSVPLNTEDDGITGYVFTIRDMTEMEKNLALEMNREKNAVIGKLSADMAHEIRNPLGSIELFADLLKKDMKRKKDIARINQIITAAKHVEEQITTMILRSKTLETPITCVNLHDLLRDILLSSERTIDQETAFLSVTYADIEPMVACNPDMIKRVCQNLVFNALRAIPDGGRLDITTHHMIDQQTIEIHFTEHSVLASNNVQSGIYDAFSNTKEGYQGFGIALIHNIVNMNKGTIRVEYTPGAGTVFILSFPLAKVDDQPINHP